MRFPVKRSLLLLTVIAWLPQEAHGQRLSGLVYSDYSYLIQSESGEGEGENGFGFRRLYLTSDFAISDDFSVRARLEANDKSTTSQGRLTPFLKDLFLRWNNFVAEGHVLHFGISPPPSFTVSERIYGFRSLEATIQDREKVVSSRDTGIALRGPVGSSGLLRYGVMVADDSGGKPESNKGKRVYGQLEVHPGSGVAVTVGADYAERSGSEKSAVNVNAFVGYRASNGAVGVEVFSNRADRVGVPDLERLGVSVFGRVAVAPRVVVVARFDRSMTEVGATSTWGNYGLVGVSLRPHERVRFIPNVVVVKDEASNQASVTGRVTLHADF